MFISLILLLLPLAKTANISNQLMTQSATYQSSSATAKTTPPPAPPGSPVPTSEQATKMSSRYSQAAMSHPLTIPSHSPQPCPEYPILPMGSKITEVHYVHTQETITSVRNFTKLKKLDSQQQHSVCPFKSSESPTCGSFLQLTQQWTQPSPITSTLSITSQSTPREEIS